MPPEIEAPKVSSGKRRMQKNLCAEGASEVEYAEGCPPSQPTRGNGERR